MDARMKYVRGGAGSLWFSRGANEGLRMTSVGSGPHGRFLETLDVGRGLVIGTEGSGRLSGVKDDSHQARRAA